MKQICNLTLLCLASFVSLQADVSYTQTTRYTGGTVIEMVKSMAGNPMMKMMGGNRMQAAFQDQTVTVYIKGGKMAFVGPSTTRIHDLDAGTITLIDHTEKTYSVMTMEEMKEAMANMARRR